MLEVIVYGIVLGSIIALGSVGLTLIWGITDLFNCAHGDQITTTGPVATHGSAISTGSGTAVAGSCNVVIPGRVGGDVMVHSQKQVGAGSPEDFQALLDQIREQLTALQGLQAEDRAEAESELDKAAQLAEKDEPPSSRIVRALENVREIAQAAAGTAAAAATVAPLVARAIEMAQSLFY